MCDVLCAVYNYPCCGGTLCVMYCAVYSYPCCGGTLCVMYCVLCITIHVVVGLYV